jgi:hypothetical protein
VSVVPHTGRGALLRLAACLLLTMAVGCGGSGPDGEPASDAGRPDGPAADAGSADALPLLDAGPHRADAGPEPERCRTDEDCADGLFCNGEERCREGQCVPAPRRPCRDDDPCTVDRCREATDRCTHIVRDRDGDGFADEQCGGADCVDTDRSIHPTAPEHCGNGQDDDCDGLLHCEDPDCRTHAACSSSCPDGDLGSATGTAIAEGRTRGAGDELQGRCSINEAEEVAWAWTAPRDGKYSFDTFGSDYDTVLYVRADGCGGEPRACNDDSSGMQSKLTVQAEAGQQFVIVVDGFRQATGHYVLNAHRITPEENICDDRLDNDGDGAADCADSDCLDQPACTPACPDRDLGSVTGMEVASGTTTGRTDNVTASCTVNEAEDVTLQWTAPQTGTYVFDTEGSDYDTVLYALDGCGGEELACSDDADGLNASLQLQLQQGQTLILVMDGWSTSTGQYVLNIAQVEPETGHCEDGVDNDTDGRTDCADADCNGAPECTTDCPQGDLGSLVQDGAATGSTEGAGDDLVGRCTFNRAEDATWAWTAPDDALYTFDTFGSSYDTLLYVLDGSCAGAELACNDDTLGLQSRVRVPLEQGQRVVLVVDGYDRRSGDYVLNISRTEAGRCDDGLDNDSDGLVDCDDPNCSSAPACCTAAPEDCSNGTDDDCDGRIDCVDEDCSDAPVC